MVNDGVIESFNDKHKTWIFNISNSLQVTKNNMNKNNTSTLRNNNGSKKDKSWISKSKCDFTPLGEPLDIWLKTLLDNKINMLLESRPWETQIKKRWWNDNHYSKFHRNKGHKTNEYMKHKHIIQDLIDNDKIKVYGHQSNNDHNEFKEPWPRYEKGESSDFKGNEINYAYKDN